MNCVDKAALFAIKAHRGQKRTGKNIPYILHPMETAAVVANMTEDLEVIAAALLHDVLEDAGITFEQIAAEFGQRVAGLVQAVSENKREQQPKAETWKIRKQETIDALNKENDLAVKMLAVADKLSNIRAIYHDHLALGDRLWARFNQKDPKMHAWYYRSVLEATEELKGHPAWLEYDYLVEKVFS